MSQQKLNVNNIVNIAYYITTSFILTITILFYLFSFTGIILSLIALTVLKVIINGKLLDTSRIDTIISKINITFDIISGKKIHLQEFINSKLAEANNIWSLRCIVFTVLFINITIISRFNAYISVIFSIFIIYALFRTFKEIINKISLLFENRLFMLCELEILVDKIVKKRNLLILGKYIYILYNCEDKYYDFISYMLEKNIEIFKGNYIKTVYLVCNDFAVSNRFKWLRESFRKCGLTIDNLISIITNKLSSIDKKDILLSAIKLTPIQEIIDTGNDIAKNVSNTIKRTGQISTLVIDGRFKDAAKTTGLSILEGSVNIGGTFTTKVCSRIITGKLKCFGGHIITNKINSKVNSLINQSSEKVAECIDNRIELIITEPVRTYPSVIVPVRTDPVRINAVEKPNIYKIESIKNDLKNKLNETKNKILIDIRKKEKSILSFFDNFGI